ncbi:MAG: hypothetical protein UT66_C0027G0011 [candidate division CPR2 bacterium GW2011_GWC1_39_9]|uniref:Membrane-bound metal-dependent hydrolase n=1 Tax=candidate division CPR2 bacterium GW2011_GWC2_39_10 TaxID=1618345 RepID=A0A0G0M033_UNCC2|nr:MAG: hypothetical protein UT18_C0017G0020 [candidate division CPR2 bacterium GW2011_GWC2_39_10]KKR34180.1 MAG: hypothetical protein UT66_C0027G0011 [candidate division CPR2 bacterium GW2011_GWC1_39_9]
MLIPTHLFVTTCVAFELHLTGTELITAYIFGVLIDLDHLTKIKRLREKDFWLAKGKFCDHTWLHEPLGLIVVILISIIIQSKIPVIFYSIHFFMDHFLLKAKSMPFLPFRQKVYSWGFIPSGSKVEWFLAPLFIIISIYLAWNLF